ncbi:30S ribosomal protein S6 [Paracoccaceae bacterium]|nr:30S ribosomal protein S6 [Paracoccaceae bacterium]
MPNYEHVLICRQDLTSAQAEALAEEFKATLTDNGGKIIGSEYWGLRSIAYRMNKNRKGHYFMLKSESNSKAVAEMERLMNIHEDIMRFLTIKVKEHGNGHSIMMNSKAKEDEERV